MLLIKKTTSPDVQKYTEKQVENESFKIFEFFIFYSLGDSVTPVTSTGKKLEGFNYAEIFDKHLICKNVEGEKTFMQRCPSLSRLYTH